MLIKELLAITEARALGSKTHYMVQVIDGGGEWQDAPDLQGFTDDNPDVAKKKAETAMAEYARKFRRRADEVRVVKI